MSGWINSRIDKIFNEWIDGLDIGWMDGRIDKILDGWMD